MIRLLVLTRHFPYAPMHGGDSTYSRGVIEALGDVAKVTALAADHAIVRFGPVSKRGAVTWRLTPRSQLPATLSFAGTMPNIMWVHATRAYHTELDRLLTQPWNVVAIDHLGAAHALPQVKAWRSRTPTGRLLYISHEHETSARREKYASYGGNPLKRLAMRLDLAKIHAWEMRLLSTADVISVINPEETALYRADAPDKTYVGLPPGFSGRWAPSRVIDANTPRRLAVVSGWRTEHKRLILKRWLETAAAPLAEAGVEHLVFGDIDDDLRAAHQARFPRVRFMGYVDDLGRRLQDCRLGVVPDFVGRGVKLRLLDYIASRTPMAAVKNAIDGLPLAAPAQYREADDLQALTSLCIDLIDDFAALNGLQQAAFTACEAQFAWRDRALRLISALGRPTPK